MERTRRSVLKAGAGVAALGAFAGCLDTDAVSGQRTGGPDGFAAFFTLYDWGNQVGGDGFTFETPVEAGRMGHGWTPDGDVARRIGSSEMFLYLDTPEFSWAQDVAATLRRDYDGVTVVDALADLDPHLLPFGGDGEGEFHDPHVWTDPVLAVEMIETLTEALAEADPGNAESYRDNAEAYGERLADVDRQFEDLLANAERDVAVLAGHDSFQYLSRRYGFTLHTPTGVSPDAAESFEDISDLVEIIETNDIHTVLYDPFAAHDSGDDFPQMVDVIFENTDVDSAEPLTPAEGTTAAWQERDWGWIEQMTEINLPSLGKALDA